MPGMKPLVGPQGIASVMNHFKNKTSPVSNEVEI
jgi:hypothetical protein